MLPRLATAYGRVSATSLARFRIASRPPALPRRNISFLPWGRNRLPQSLPVYFPRTTPRPQSSAWKGRLGRVVFTTLALYTCWEIFATVVFDPLLDWADSEFDSMSQGEKEEMEQRALDADEPILFLPFPFTKKKVQEPPYNGSDPEWATFVAVSRDPKLQKDIKLSLAQIIRLGVERNPAYAKLLGGKDIKIRKVWLDILYPPRPPPRYYVSGIIVEDDGIYWGDRPMDSLAAGHLDMALYPKAVALTVWTFFNFLFKQTAQDIAKALGLSTSSPPEAAWQAVVLNRSREQGAFEGSGRQPANVSEHPGKLTSVPVQTAGSNATATPFSGESQVDTRVQAALQAASLTFSENWQPVKQLPNRGCIRVDGLVELKGTTASMVVYALAWYDPKQLGFMGIQLSLKHLVHHTQKPAGS